ncbi:unnamed protein product [Schistosoma margrebowiei]|uniref:Uncharacterized protein n=1 Tax=Schistosoma margrebowiei TaxID=48269 RepID=A0A3P7XTW4_9TREM|nr:unnamed protein product [Schistosoma margrebowiei]
MVVGGSQQETLDPDFVLLGTRQQGVPVILREPVLPGGFDPVPLSFIVRDVTIKLSGPRPTFCRTEMDYKSKYEVTKSNIVVNENTSGDNRIYSSDHFVEIFFEYLLLMIYLKHSFSL